VTGIKQKSILATCNYVARRRGVKKLMLISEARKLCPDLVLVDGEDLTAFRDVSKALYGLLRSFSWGDRAERLGLDEVFLDVTDVIAYNVELLNRADLTRSFFQLSRQDPEQGFSFDATQIVGCVAGSSLPIVAQDEGAENPLYWRLLVASHLARHMRLKLEERGYTSACGISTSKLLSKLVGSQNKPRNQTTLMALTGQQVLSFIDTHTLRKVPGIGSRTVRVLEAHLPPSPSPSDALMHVDHPTTVHTIRTNPTFSAPVLERLLAGPGAERGVGERVWALLHGVDAAEVKAAANVPSQISIEDTYRGLSSPEAISPELRKLALSLLRRMHTDLVEDGRRWLAVPRTLRLTTRPYAPTEPYGFARASRSCALPAFATSLSVPREVAAEKLAAECLQPMFRHLNPGPAYNIGLLNVCVANMGGAGEKGRDIGAMFRTREEELREFTVYDPDPKPEMDRGPLSELGADSAAGDGWEGPQDEESETESWGDDEAEACPTCGRWIPRFASFAHQRYHALGD
jgi:DNA polymerase iota